MGASGVNYETVVWRGAPGFRRPPVAGGVGQVRGQGNVHVDGVGAIPCGRSEAVVCSYCLHGRCG